MVAICTAICSIRCPREIEENIMEIPCTAVVSIFSTIEMVPFKGINLCERTELFGAGFSSLILIQMLCSTGILILYSSNKSILINACQKYLHSFFCCKHYIIFSFSLNNFLEACHLSLIFHQSFFCNHDHQVYLHTNAYDFLDFSYASINLELFTVKIEK